MRNIYHKTIGFIFSDKIALRKAIQAFFLAVTLFIGIRFYFFLDALGRNDLAVTKPGGVEAFLPISALLGLKRFVMTGNYDWIHPAGLTLLMLFILISILFKRGFCGYICPIGLVSESVSYVGKNFKINKYVSYILLVLKFALLAFLINLFVVSMTLSSIEWFLNMPYNKVSDAKMMNFFTAPSSTTIYVLVALVILGLLFKNFWCRFLCPYGALMGVVSLISPFKVKRNVDSCIDCKKCTKVCPMDIQVHQKKTVHTPECIGCHDCIRVRANDECLTTTVVKDYRLLTLAVFSVFWIVVIGAMVLGFWESSVSNLEYRMLLERINQISH